jgi:hypothetical protein
MASLRSGRKGRRISRPPGPNPSEAFKTRKVKVYLVIDADKAGGEGSRVITDLFPESRSSCPAKDDPTEDMDLTNFMKGRKME